MQESETPNTPPQSVSQLPKHAASGAPTTPERKANLQYLLHEWANKTDDPGINSWFENLTKALERNRTLPLRKAHLEIFLFESFFQRLRVDLSRLQQQLPRWLAGCLDGSTGQRDPYRLIQQLDHLTPVAANPEDRVQALELVLESLSRLQAHRPRSRITALPKDDFNATFQGPALNLLADHIIAHNYLFPPSSPSPQNSKLVDSQSNTPQARAYYSKVLPILQSSGFGKTRMCAELSTISPGMLVCLRSQVNDPFTSFPPQDQAVYSYFQDCMSLVSERGQKDKPQAPLLEKQQYRIDHNKAHLRVMSWLAIYCQTIAHYLTQLKQDCGCFEDEKLASCASRNRQACWNTVVFALAFAMRISGFLWTDYYQRPDLCPNSCLLDLIDRRQPAIRTNRNTSPSDLPPPIGSTDFRSEVLTFIGEAAENFYTAICEELGSKISEENVFIGAINKHLLPRLASLELSAPKSAHQAFHFLALDECGSVTELLPVIRRVWSYASPRSTWILLVDTNPDLAPITGNVAREASRRMDADNTHQLSHPFSTMPLDVNLTSDMRQRLYSTTNPYTLRDLNRHLRKLGRPLWNDASYHGADGLPDPNLILTKLVYPGNWKWPTRPSIPSKIDDDITQNLLTLASRRLSLELTSNTGPQPVYNFINQQIGNHMRYVGSICSDSDTIITSTPSEPPLSVATAWFFRLGRNETAAKWSLVIQAIVLARTPLGINMGAQGEQGVALLSTMATDIAANYRYADDLLPPELRVGVPAISDKAVVGLITVREWLETLIGSKFVVSRSATRSANARHYDHDMEVDQHGRSSADPIQMWQRWADRAWINFKHIVTLEERVSNVEAMDTTLLLDLWFRHAGAQGISNQPDWDLLIPVYESDESGEPPIGEQPINMSRFSYIAIQVKNRIDRPDKKTREAAIGPHLGNSKLGKQCLELLFDLRGPSSLQGHTYEQRHHPVFWPSGNTTSAQEVVQAQVQESVLLRHHFFISGMDETSIPILQELSDAAKDQVRLLFGSTESPSTIAFYQGLLKQLRNSDVERLNAWHHAMAHKQGVYSRARPNLAQSQKRGRQNS